MVFKVSRARDRKEDMVSGKRFHVLLGHPKGLEKREDQLQGIPGPIALGRFSTSAKKSSYLLTLEKNSSPRGDMPGQFQGIVVFGYGTFAIGGKESVRHESPSLRRSVFRTRLFGLFRFYRLQPDQSANYMKKCATMGIKFIFWQQFGKVRTVIVLIIWILDLRACFGLRRDLSASPSTGSGP